MLYIDGEPYRMMVVPSSFEGKVTVIREDVSCGCYDAHLADQADMMELMLKWPKDE